jgi:hypothetical protein
MPRVVGSGDQTGVGVDANRPGVFARRPRQTGGDSIGGAAGRAGVGEGDRGLNRLPVADCGLRDSE